MTTKKPSGYWTSKEHCAEEALKYTTRSAFGKGSPGANIAARKRGWMDDICGHMEEKKKPASYWTKERCAEEALKYKTKTAFSRGSSGAHQSSQANGWLDDVCSHMEERKKPNGYWTKERCSDEAKKYKTKYAFEKGTVSAYNAARVGGYLDDICGHMISPYKPSGYWTKERCAEEALKYTTRLMFSNGSCGAYSAAQRNKWLDDVCVHMKRIGNIATRSIYAVIFPDDRLVYVGLSFNPTKRIRSHASCSSNRHVRRLIAKGNLVEFKIFVEWYDKDRAGKVEHETIEMFRREGYGILNISKAGAIGGGHTKWTLDRCSEEARKYTTRGEFNKGSSAYKAAYINNWLDDICGHMISPYKPSGYWNKEHCAEEALKYTSRHAFSAGIGSAYNAALLNGWLDDICGHMVERKKPNGYWTKDRCIEEALKYTTRSGLEAGSSGAYNAALQNGWMDDICGHMEEKKKPAGYWNRDRCAEEALKYTTRQAFSNDSGGSYNVSRRNGWLDDICGHMEERRKPNGYWTKERCAEEALKYTTRCAFRVDNGGAYRIALSNGWLDELFPK